MTARQLPYTTPAFLGQDKKTKHPDLSVFNGHMSNLNCRIVVQQMDLVFVDSERAGPPSL